MDRSDIDALIAQLHADAGRAAARIAELETELAQYRKVAAETIGGLKVLMALVAARPEKSEPVP